MEEALEQTSEQFWFAPLDDLEAPDQWMVSTIQALYAYSDQKEIIARTSAVEAWNSRFGMSILSVVWRNFSRSYVTLNQGSKEATVLASWIRCRPNLSIPPGGEWI